MDNEEIIFGDVWIRKSDNLRMQVKDLYCPNNDARLPVNRIRMRACWGFEEYTDTIENFIKDFRPELTSFEKNKIKVLYHVNALKALGVVVGDFVEDYHIENNTLKRMLEND